MTDRRKVLPDFSADKASAEMAELIRHLRTVGPFAAEIAAHRREMFLAYVEAGFTEAQALDITAKALF